MAYSNSNIRGEGIGCVLWFGDLIDIRLIPNGGLDLYIRIEASKQGASCLLGSRFNPPKSGPRATVAHATDNFSVNNKLGEGGFGPVYKGTLIDGQEIAVKRLSKCSGQGLNEFKNEVKLIAKLQH
ncbi:hypothetical protein RND71_015228 [Anisodus tanguticus]|uniref:Protein kinase domain-containing protein n=1 Tax=Anisodus tanguticus TaxID=243964 RepID=A0AAE1S5G1_9SOLA|nr:hypothetical protein RND71_015228 [Anisodus tanguticus]